RINYEPTGITGSGIRWIPCGTRIIWKDCGHRGRLSGWSGDRYGLLARSSRAPDGSYRLQGSMVEPLAADAAGRNTRLGARSSYQSFILRTRKGGFRNGGFARGYPQSRLAEAGHSRVSP